MEESFEDIAQIRQQVPAIGHLDRIGRRFVRGPGIGRGPIAADDLNAGMLAEPASEGRGFAIRQQVDGAAPFEVDEDRAEGRRPAKGEIIDTEDAGCRPEVRRGGLDATEQGVGTGWHRQPSRQSRAPFAAERESDRELRLAEALRRLGVGGDGRQTLGEGPLRAPRVGAPEAPEVDADADVSTLPGEVGNGADIPAMDPVRSHVASGAICGAPGGLGLDSHAAATFDQVANDETAILREQLGDVHDAPS